MRALDIGHLSLTALERSVLIDWRQMQRGRRWRLAVGPHPLCFPLEMPPHRKVNLFGLVFAWYPKGYEPS